MSTNRKQQALGFVLLLVLAVTPVFAVQGSGTKAGGMNTDEMAVTLEGTVVASAGSGAKGVQDYRIKVIRALNENGAELKELKGVVLSLADVAKAKEMIKYHGDGDRLVIEGKLKNNKKQLDVSQFARAAQGSDSK